MTDGPKGGRKPKRPYIRLSDRRRRGGQPGNKNAYKIGFYTARARAKRREIWLLLQEIRWVLAAAQPFVENVKAHPKKSKTNGADCLDGASGCADGPAR
jgi:hypothetical protein